MSTDPNQEVEMPSSEPRESRPIANEPSTLAEAAERAETPAALPRYGRVQRLACQRG
jgi:hypothetical protein